MCFMRQKLHHLMLQHGKLLLLLAVLLLCHSIASPGLLLFFFFFPSSFSVSSCLFLVWLNRSIALSPSSLLPSFSPLLPFSWPRTSALLSSQIETSISNSTNSSTSFSASLVSSSPAPLSLSSCLTLTRHSFARILKRSLTNREMTGIPSATREEATACRSAPFSLDPAFSVDEDTLSCHSSQEFDIFLFSPHHYRSNINDINKRFWEKWL